MKTFIFGKRVNLGIIHTISRKIIRSEIEIFSLTFEFT